ncbi:AfsR/SARP family transcriptional regulator [Micromonospora sp. WMMD1082]|uniref:AfsR/SARP family transcriptional regulator n=1 Tax=Micromonospora sp. WMMD1082 TaxID=3016104 RepID=UPI0024176F09|nr:AfsR/SARP family transcriptional regulator [Micromonospora sp. WMMD1082]MDG4794575.1 AfsR/SARP family transcriptional regulator [Micromonospora sp. WMMD1082]
MKFLVLGSLDVHCDGGPADLGGVKQRAVLGYLVVNANHVVPTSRILRALWDGPPPSTARKMVQNAVSSIRRMLAAQPGHEPPASLVTSAPGYQLRVDPEAVDLFEFRRRVQQGRAALAAGSTAAGARALREALALWRGRALADLVETGTDWSELAAIEDERLTAYEDFFDAQLSRGRHREITPQLEVLMASEPMRERLCRQFMLALYRSGRQAEALDVYRRTRTAFVEGLGIEPGRGLQELQHMILKHDLAIQVPVGASS